MRSKPKFVQIVFSASPDEGLSDALYALDSEGRVWLQCVWQRQEYWSETATTRFMFADDTSSIITYEEGDGDA